MSNVSWYSLSATRRLTVRLRRRTRHPHADLVTALHLYGVWVLWDWSASAGNLYRPVYDSTSGKSLDHATRLVSVVWGTNTQFPTREKAYGVLAARWAVLTAGERMTYLRGPLTGV